MIRLVARTTLLLATTLVVLAQVVVAPAACCVLRSAVLGEAACCVHGTVRPVETSDLPPCCRRHAAETAAGDSAGVPVPFRPEACLWCSAGPKIGASERAVPPSPDFSSTLAALPAAALPSPAPVASEEVPAYGPSPPLTAAERCALHCVWLI